jgi:hypothetical protein
LIKTTYLRGRLQIARHRISRHNIYSSDGPSKRSNLNKEQVMSKKFAGKMAIVTGGSTGMGLATAKRFVQVVCHSARNPWFIPR